MAIDETITVHDINADGIHGRLFRSADRSLRSGIVVLGGSGGGLGWSEGMARRLAGEGYAALALAYFRYAGLPKALVNIPLEYFEKAFDWMADQQGIDTKRLALVGGSRGAELALILGSTFPAVRAVVGYASSSVAWGADGGLMSIGKPAWTYQDKPLLPAGTGFSPAALFELVRIGVCLVSRVRYSGTPRFAAILKKESSIAHAVIPVENIQGPVLLISGDDDQIWPSTLMSEMIMDRLREHKHPFTDKHLKYQGAGHAINLPDLPREAYPTWFTHPRTRIKYNAGGNIDTNVQASKQAWNQVVRFLKEHVAC
ncbi:MAG: hypothetical protein JW993_20760 [Sedimentisphaerales bacterium]|nr:hypothetical protein [Sedimentisphaerales bacterium]